jgi:hypothetical protein
MERRSFPRRAVSAAAAIDADTTAIAVTAAFAVAVTAIATAVNVATAAVVVATATVVDIVVAVVAAAAVIPVQPTRLTQWEAPHRTNHLSSWFGSGNTS